MKKLLLILALLVVGCGGGGGGGSSDGGSNDGSTSHTPAISDLFALPSRVEVGSGGGTATVTGIYNYIDNGADITTLVLEICGNTVTSPIDQELAANVSGTLGFIAADIPTTAPYDCDVQIWVVDSQGNSSNVLTHTLTVY